MKPTAPRSRTTDLLIGLFAVVGVLELITGFTARIEGADSASHLIWIRQFIDLVNDGVWFPKWLPTGFHGVGSPTFYYYPPLAYYAGWLVSLFGLSDPTAIFHVVSVLATLASGYACYALVRPYAVSRDRAILAGLLYAFAPYRVAELYSRSSLSSHVGYVFLPIVALALVRLFERRNEWDLRNTLILSVAASALVLSSIPATACAACFEVIAIATQLRRMTWRFLAQLGIAAVLSFGLTAFYSIPAFTHTADAQISRFWKDPYFFIVELARLHVTTELAHTALLALAVLLMVGALIVDRSLKDSVARTLVLSGVLLVAALQLPVVSLPLWRHIPLLQFIQVPWRLYIGLVLAMSIVVAIVRSPRAIRLSAVGVIVLAIGSLAATSLPLFNLHFFSHWVSKDADPPEYLSARASLEVVHQPEVPAGERWSAAIDQGQPNELVRLLNSDAYSRVYSVTLAADRRVHFRQLYWKEWRFFAAGHEISGFEDDSGYHAALLPAGSYTLAFRLVNPASEERAAVVSIGSASFALGLFAVLLVRRRPKTHALEMAGKASPELALDVETSDFAP